MPRCILNPVTSLESDAQGGESTDELCRILSPLRIPHSWEVVSLFRLRLNRLSPIIRFVSQIVERSLITANREPIPLPPSRRKGETRGLVLLVGVEYTKNLRSFKRDNLVFSTCAIEKVRFSITQTRKRGGSKGERMRGKKPQGFCKLSLPLAAGDS